MDREWFICIPSTLMLLTENHGFLENAENECRFKVMHYSTIFHEFIYVQGKVDKEKSVLKCKEFRVTTRSWRERHIHAGLKQGCYCLKRGSCFNNFFFLFVSFKLMLNENTLFYLEIYEFF